MLVLLLSVVLADSLKSSMGSSLGSVPSDMGQKKKRKENNMANHWLVVLINDIEEVEQSIDA